MSWIGMRRARLPALAVAVLGLLAGCYTVVYPNQTPRPDGFGARFIFQRIVDDKPFVTPESEEIHFVAPLSDTYRLDRRFKVKDMMFEGKLEY